MQPLVNQTRRKVNNAYDEVNATIDKTIAKLNPTKKINKMSKIEYMQNIVCKSHESFFVNMN